MGAYRQERWTASGVRLRQVTAGEGRGNWLFVPGGPGLGSESLLGLVRAAQVPGAAWLVDLPGDGSNRGLPGLPAEPYTHWPGALAEARGSWTTWSWPATPPAACSCSPSRNSKAC